MSWVIEVIGLVIANWIWTESRKAAAFLRILKTAPDLKWEELQLQQLWVRVVAEPLDEDDR